MNPPVSLQWRVQTLPMATHHGKSRPGSLVDLLVIHTTAGGDALGTIHWMNGQEKQISYHYVIAHDGMIYKMCPVTTVAYHAGDSAFPANFAKAPHQGTSVNARSVGISFANMNNGEPLTEAQLDSGLWLCGAFCRGTVATVDPISVDHIVGHSEVAPLRKSDPDPAIRPAGWRAMVKTYLDTYTP